jgi:hypothetical protein
MPDAFTPKDIYEALFALQADPIVLVKDQQGQVGSQKTTYADLIQAQAVIFPRLQALGLLWVSAPTIRMLPDTGEKDGPRFVLDWELRHIASKTKIDGAFPLPPNANPMQNGSAITYARRYALTAATNAVADKEDDDGGGYAGRRGYASRANIPQEPRSQVPPAATAQRGAQPRVASERARPAQQPALPSPREAAPAGEPVDPDGLPTRGRGGLITEPMTRKLAISMREAGITGDDRLATIIAMTGRHDLTTSRELTFEEGRAAIDAVEKSKGKENPEAAIDIYFRAGGPNAQGGPSAAEAVPTAEQAEIGHPPTKRTAAAKKATPAAPRTTRESVTGTADPNGEPAPWEAPTEEPPTWPTDEPQ